METHGLAPRQEATKSLHQSAPFPLPSSFLGNVTTTVCDFGSWTRHLSARLWSGEKLHLLTPPRRTSCRPGLRSRRSEAPVRQITATGESAQRTLAPPLETLTGVPSCSAGTGTYPSAPWPLAPWPLADVGPARGEAASGLRLRAWAAPGRHLGSARVLCGGVRAPACSLLEQTKLH